MTKDEIVKYWIEASEFDFRAMQNLYTQQRLRMVFIFRTSCD